jgi:peptidoglycan/LPS O-acetylase OafA/YrhL
MVVRATLLSRRKLVALDGVRGLAILAVMLHHSSWRLSSATSAQQFFNWLMFQGWAGVDLFFVLSGFLITGILLDSRDAVNYFGSFYARRALRIFPLYYTFLLVAFLGFPFIAAATWLPVPADRWIYVTYLTNWEVLWQGPWRHSILAHLWSLAVEEQFYFCWPLLVWLVRPRVLLPGLLAGEACVIAGRLWWVLGHGASQAVVMATVTRMDGLLLGAVCAIVIRRYRLPQRFIRLMPVIAGMGISSYILAAMQAKDQDRLMETLGFPLLAVCFSLVVLYAVLTEGGTGPTQCLLTRRTLTNVGKYAYGLYVYHVPLFYFGDRLIARFAPASVINAGWFGYVSSAILITLSYQTAKLTYNGFERHFLKLKDRFEPTYETRAAAAQFANP